MYSRNVRLLADPKASRSLRTLRAADAAALVDAGLATPVQLRGRIRHIYLNQEGRAGPAPMSRAQVQPLDNESGEYRGLWCYRLLLVTGQGSRPMG